MAEYKLDIFDALRKLNSPKSGDVYAGWSEDERKGFAPLIVMRWMSGTSDEQQIILLNEFTNPYVFSLGKHPHLLARLLQASSSKAGGRFQWLGIKSKKKNVLTLQVLSEFLDMSLREARLLDPLPPPAEVMQMAEELGWQKEELKKLEKELSE